MLGCGDLNDSLQNTSEGTSSITSATDNESRSISASALGLESVMESFPSLGFGKEICESNELVCEPSGLNPGSISVIQFDARSDNSGSKAALEAIAQDFFELDADDAADNVESGNRYRTAMDDLLGGLDIPDE